ncbi:MAG: aminoacyl-tRNA hydrolase [Oligoflexia bacterium]|nr:aminoacyl-tRNA hydrolase [Oligoflexia bacterium]
MIAGLGNPGARYSATRHNAGFMVLDKLVGQLLGAKAVWKEEHSALSLKVRLGDCEALVVKPQSFMNRSGEPIQELLRYYRVEVPNLIVVHDEIDIPFGSLRVKQGGGDGGHNGIRSIVRCLGSVDFVRIRFGVGRPLIPSMEVADWVLEKFSGPEASELERLCQRGAAAVEAVCMEGVLAAQNRFNNAVRNEGAS